ncbi:hypothetical protein [Streptomyces sp. NPDC051576]|uniref:hypothetical protein n=1 Tax=Streptomyces sp. NPDC051576 TaxID=3155803 RepID=UPI003425F2AF
MSTVSWEELKRRVDEARRAAGLPVRTPEERRADKERLLAEVRAYKLVEIRRDQHLTQCDIADSIGVSTARISAIEHGEIDRTEVATLRTSGVRSTRWPEWTPPGSALHVREERGPGGGGEEEYGVGGVGAL